MLIALPLLLVAIAVVLVVGPRMARTADGLAEATGMGGALFGVVFLALATDLPELALTPTAVLTGTPRIALGGVLGGAAAQLTLIAVVDIGFRKGSLMGHASQRTALAQCALMASVLAVPLMVVAGGPTFRGIGIGTVLLPLTYLGVLAAIRGISGDGEPGSPPDDDETVSPSGADEADTADPQAADQDASKSLWSRFAGFAVLLAGAGVALESTTETIGSQIGLGETASGALLAGLVAPLPELVTAMSAARAGAVDLAIGDLIGSSALDVTLIALADVFYTEGSIFELIGRPELTLVGMALAVTSLVLVGLARRESPGARRVAVESYLMLGVYVAGAVLVVTATGTAG